MSETAAEDVQIIDLGVLKCHLPRQELTPHTWRRLNLEEVASATEWVQAAAAIN